MFFYNTLFVLFATSLQRGNIEVKAECHALGCVLTPIDILYDEPAKEALSVLRQAEEKSSIGHQKEDGDDSGEENRNVSLRESALSALRSAGDDSKTTMTLRGYKGGRVADQINQDRALIVSPFNIIADPSKSQPVAQLLGVFDGHGRGGEKTSQYAVDHVPSLLAAKLASVIDQENVESYSEAQVIEALKETFDEVDKNDPSLGSAGCTATLVLRLGQKLFIANAGDSVSFVGVYFAGKSVSETESPHENVQIMFQSREDKPDLPEERARIIAAGGYVNIPKSSSGDVPRAYYIDANRKARYGLAMSRSLGDWKVPGVIAEPIVDVLDLSVVVEKALASYSERCTKDADNEEKIDEKNRYCDFKDSRDIRIFAASISDGMMDYLSPDSIGKTLATAFFEKDSTLHPHSAAEKLVIEAATGWQNEYQGGYRDDIAMASFS
eukprot:CAMPEP_0116142460 /NCGR_PEP_ID=MMETSP0329-20121206/14922_1 /TAXON_ID=697910 /ORGANISM="Pseudo-nitzschia arenysensis, Strain B593" /LENGTH=439 /DNA_ID=CAMNT_0003637701 /DNA_START=10 /DNA_END=1326 /DNA_ORIENTATION=+